MKVKDLLEGIDLLTEDEVNNIFIELSLDWRQLMKELQTVNQNSNLEGITDTEV